MSKKETMCFAMKANIIGEEILKSFTDDTSKDYNHYFQFIIFSLGGFSIENPKQTFNENCNLSIKNFEIEFFDLERFIKSLKQNNINPKFYNDLKSIKDI